MLAAFLATRLGKYIAGAVAALAVLAAVVWRIFSAGEASQKAKVEKSSLENLRKRSDTHDSISKKPDAARRAALREWVSDDDGR